MAISVLVVDDDPTCRALAERLLTEKGFEVVGQADCVAAAISAAKALEPDAALVDVELPDGNGIALAGELVALPWRPRVVLTSIDPDAAGADDVRRSGARGFLHKTEWPHGDLGRLLTSD